MFVVWETFALCNGAHHLSLFIAHCSIFPHCTAHCQVHTAHCARVLPWESSITAQEPLWPCTHSTGQSLHLLTSSSSPSSPPSSSSSSPSSSHWWNIMSQLVLADCLPHRRHLHAWTRKPTHCFLRIIVLVMSSQSVITLNMIMIPIIPISWYLSSHCYDTYHHVNILILVFSSSSSVVSAIKSTLS